MSDYPNPIVNTVLTEPSAEHPIAHPDYYGGEDNPYEAIKVIEAWDLGFHLGTAVKYISRMGKKSGEPSTRDLRKAVWYMQREIARLENRL